MGFFPRSMTFEIPAETHWKTKSLVIVTYGTADYRK